MKKILSVLALFTALTTGIFAYSYENTFDFSYMMPIVTWSDSTNSYCQTGSGLMFDYRGTGESLGFQLNAGISVPTTVFKTNNATGIIDSYNAQESSDFWYVTHFFAGVSFRTITTELVELFIVPGVSFTNDVILSDDDIISNNSFGAGIDVVTNVILSPGLGISAGCLFEYQFYATKHSTLSGAEAARIANFSFTPRAGVSLTF